MVKNKYLSRSRVWKYIRDRNTNSKTFETFDHKSQASLGYHAVIVVNVYTIQRPRRHCVVAVNGMVRRSGSRETTVPKRVATATIIANGSVRAKPHVRSCGVMKVSQHQVRIPIQGRVKQYGIR